MEGLFDKITKEKSGKHRPVKGLVHKKYRSQKTGLYMFCLFFQIKTARKSRKPVKKHIGRTGMYHDENGR
jgi:hypothetical protein